jgi:hypothetical protein
VDALTSFDEGVVYAILHEQIYCEGYVEHDCSGCAILTLLQRSTQLVC